MVFSACRKEDNRVFTETADQRLNKTLTTYQNELVGAANGWKAIITPANQVPYQFYFRFNNTNRVVMYADFDSTTAAVPRESSYRLKALQQPSLVFDTYSYIHLLADPDANVNGGSFGAGLSSDFEFAFEKMSGDTIKLIGRINKTRVDLVKATKQEADNWQNQNWARALTSVRNLDRIVNYFKRLTINGTEYEVIIDQATRMVFITWVDGSGVTRRFSSRYTYSPTNGGISFNTPLNTGNGIIPGLYGITFNTGTNAVDVNIGNNVNASIIGATRPVSPDLTAPSRFWNRSVTADAYWISITGFTVNGVVDSFGLRTIPGFQYLLFWSQFNVSGGITYDLLGFVVNDALSFGPAFRPPTFTADGRIIFTYLGTLGTVPPSATTVVTNTRTLMSDPNGFYLVQTGENSFDMVSARDAKSWMSFIWIW